MIQGAGDADAKLTKEYTCSSILLLKYRKNLDTFDSID